MKMPHDRVFKKMQEAESENDIDRGASPQDPETFGHEFKKNERQEEPCTEGEKVFLNLSRPVFPHDDQRAAKHFRRRGDKAEENDGQHRVTISCTERPDISPPA